MELLLHTVALCRQGLTEIAVRPESLPLSLLVAGFAGSLMHCVGMCGPFVLAQVVGDAARRPADGYSEWRRLRGAALLPYHLGRLTTYAGLGAIAGMATAIFAASAAFGWMSGALLTIGASFMLAQAAGLAHGTIPLFGRAPTLLASRLSDARGVGARFGLGVVLGFLPCGLVYGALGAAAGSGSPWRGFLSMAAFGLGTVPALVAIGWGGMLLRRRWQGAGRWLALPLLLASALLMIALAVERIGQATGS